MAQVGWKPCICTAAREAAERGRGMGHLLVFCNTCHDQLWQTTFYQPPHEHQPPPARSMVSEPDPPVCQLLLRELSEAVNLCPLDCVD